MADNVRAHAIITGIVQGVFFRMETQRAAEQHNVVGWVRNRRDGSVEAVFEGDRKEVDAVLDWCREGPDRAIVHAFAAAGGGDLITGLHQIFEDELPIGVDHNSAGRHANDEIVGAGAVTIVTLTGLSGVGFPVFSVG